MIYTVSGGGIQMKILQIGWRGRATKALKEFDCNVTVVATFDQRAGGLDRKEFADSIILVHSVRNSEELWLALNELLDLSVFDLILGFDEFSLFPAAVISRLVKKQSQLKIPLISRMRSKYLQKKIIEEKKIKCANFELLNDLDAPSLAPSIPFPFVIKPVSGAGTMHTYKVIDQEDFKEKSKKLTQSGTKTALIESFVSGKEHCFDGWVENGKLKFWTCTSFTNNVLEIQSGHTLIGQNIVLTDHELTVAECFLTEVLEALEYKHGVFHLEAFLHEEGTWYFSECAMRVGGAGIPLFYETVFGKDLFKVSAELFIRESSPALDRKIPGVAGWVNIPVTRGKVVYIPPKNEFLKIDGIEAVDLEIVEGEEVADIGLGSFVKLGTAVVSAKDPKDFNLKVNEFLKWIGNEVVIEKQ